MLDSMRSKIVLISNDDRDILTCHRLALEEAGFQVLSPRDAGRRSAIVCFKASEPARLHAWLMDRKVITTCRRDSLRLSLGIYNTEEEIDAFVHLVKDYPA